MKKKKLIFLSLISITPANINSNNIYTSVLKKFIDNKYDVYIMNPIEKRYYSGQKEGLYIVDKVNYINIKIGNITKTNKIEKGISTINIERLYINAIKKYLKDINFDIVLYPTPPITFSNVIKYLKNRDDALTYLMLKDIFPQNAVDLGFFGKNSIFYKYFRKKEKELYRISDYIGCMSQANVDYIINNNDIIKDKVEIFPNSINPIDLSITKDKSDEIRKKYNLPLDKKIFLYGGNLGKPQGIEFLIKCIKNAEEFKNIIFLIIGNGTEYEYISKAKENQNLSNLILMDRLEKDEFDNVAASSDVGIISLDHRFTIPNYPSRIITYMQVKLPILAITDPNTDIGSDIVKCRSGWWINDNSIITFRKVLKIIENEFNDGDIDMIKNNSFDYLNQNFNVNKAFLRIESKVKNI